MKNAKNLISRADKLQQADSRKETPAIQARRRVLPYYVAAGLLLPVGLAQSWFAFGRRSIAYELPELERQITAIKAEIDQAYIDSETLQSPKRIGGMANAMGFARPVTPPVLVPPSGTAPKMETLEAVASQVSKKKPVESKSAIQLPFGIPAASAGEPKVLSPVNLPPASAEERAETR